MLVSTRDFVTRLSESGLSVMLPPDMAAALLKLPTAEDAARKLIERNLLTEFQARVLADGDNVPLIIGDYIVVGSLGRGGMGYVLKARHRRMKRDVAIKFLLKELTASTDMRRRFEREVEAAAQLNHQNIVTAYDAGEHTDGSCYLVMQFVDGDDLSHLVKANGPLKLPQAIDVICQAAEGLAFAHDKGIVHRDIKPGNLLLDKDGVVRILDMGLARMRPSPGDSLEGGAHADLTNTGSVMGTIDYMAPEQALDAKSADHRADIYSLGCTLWFLLSGNPPYRSDTIMRRLLAHREQQIPSVRSLWPDAPSELDDIFKSMMAKSKEDRFPSMRHLIVALRGLDKEDLEVGQMATMDVAEESAFSAKRSKSERFTPLSSPTAPLPLSEQQIKGAKPVLPAAIPADPTVIQNGAASSASETVTFNNNESRVARRPRKKTSRPAGSSRSAVEQAPTKSLVLSKRVALIAGISFLAIALAVALWSTRKPAASTNNTTEIAQSSEGQQPESSSPPAPPPPAIAPFDAMQANVHQAAWAKHLGVQVETVNSVGAKMILIPPGEFLMGSTDEQVAEVMKEVAAAHGQEFADRMKKAEQPQHRVVLSKPFWIGATEVTIGQFRKFAEATQYQTFAEKQLATDAKSWTYLKPGYAVTDESPAAAITWADAGAYCRWLSEQEQATYRLPTDAEWEYACRAGTTSAYYSGDVLLDSHEWSIRNSDVKAHPVATKRPNPFGLFDMHGNLSEWCQDRFDETWYGQSPSTDPVGPLTGVTYVLRGGNWDYNSFMRSAYRSGRTENVFHYTIGFRVVRVFAPSAMASVTPQPSVPAALNWALKFDGKQSHVRTPLVHGSDTPLTIEFTLLPGPKQYAVVSDSEGKGMGIDILNNSISFLAFRRANGKEDYVRITAPRPLAADRAYRIATVYDSGKLRLFVDGKLEASGDLKGEYLPSNLPFYLGASPEEEGIDYPFTGSLDEVRFSKVARYQADYTPVARLTADANTLALYHFDEGTGDVLRDSSSNNRHGKIIGAEWVRTDGSATTANEQPSDRHAAEWIINRGGAVYLNHSNTKFEKLTDLPSGKIEVRAVDLKKRLPEADVDIDAIRGLTHLEWVTLDMTQATPKAITGLEQATSLKRISLGGFAVTDAHLATLARLPKLNGLFLAGSRLTSQQCRTLATMPGLEKLNLTANPLIDDSSVESLSQLRNLTVLELNGTKVTATGIASLQRVLPNCDIRWDGPSLKTIEQIDSTSKPWIDWLGPKLKRNEIYGGGWVREGNAFTTEKDISGVAILSNNTRNGALRVTYLLRDSKGIVLNARDRTTGGTRELYVAQDNGKDLSIARVRDGSKYHFLAEQAVPENIAKDAPRTLEFRVIGDTLTASFNNSVIATVKDATVPDGNFALVALKGVLIQKVEYQALDGSGVDMLQKIDTARDGIGSSWKMSNGTLQTIAGPSEGDRRLYLPIENAPNEYDIRLKVQRASPRDNALMLCMVTGGRRVGLVMDGFKSRGGLWGLEQIDGKGPPDNGTAVPNEPLKVDTAADVLVQVRKTGIRVERDGKQLINWIGSPEKLSLNAKWDDKGPPRFFLGAQGDFTIHRLNFEPVESSETAWSELFNGKDLAGWEVMGVKGWSVEQGVLLGKTSTTAGNGWLMSERQFGNFELELEYKLSPGSNSGVFLRAWPEGAVDGSQFREIQLLDDDDPKFASVSANRRSGSVFGLVAPSVVPKVPADQWHRVRVHLKDQQLQLTLNDVVVLKHTLTDLRPSGRIGLQLYPNRVEFRNIRVRPVD